MSTPNRDIRVFQVDNLKLAIPFETVEGPAAIEGDNRNRPQTVRGRAELYQNILNRLITLEGTWFFDRRRGLPWINNREYGVFGILGSAPPVPVALVEAFIRQELDKEPRLKLTRNYEIYYTNPGRELSITFEVVPIDAEPFQVSTVI